MKGVFSLCCLVFFNSFLFGQDNWDFENTSNTDFFIDTRAVNGHTSEVLESNELEFRITHRFGEIATLESYRTLFGLDNSSDIRIALEYGLFKNMMIGMGRSKGAGPFLEVWDGLVKYKLYSSDKLSAAIHSTSLFTSMKRDTLPSSLIYFEKVAHRFNYNTSLIVAFKPIQNLSLQGSIGFLHQNKVHLDDQNSNLFLGATSRYKLFKKVSLLIEYYHILNPSEYRLNNYANPFGIGIEIKTYGHIFQLNFMNSRGIVEGQFLPFTRAKWSEGEFRFGFTIARKFEL